jgi:flavin reductase (DIM6/NTAB) family NADH-FMN oxidoreductase RutF
MKTAPLIEECPVSLEYSLVQAIPLGNDTLYLGEIKYWTADWNWLENMEELQALSVIREFLCIKF